MKKRPFILIEVLIAIALLALCAFPLISEPLFSYKKVREKLLELELEREAEQIYYNILKSELEFKKITTAYSTENKLPPLEISIEGLGKQVYTPHYHLYHCAPKKHTSPYYKIWVAICFGKCPKKKEEFKYKFAFLGKVLDEKSKDLHGSKKVVPPADERPASDIQAIRESGGKTS